MSAIEPEKLFDRLRRAMVLRLRLALEATGLLNSIKMHFTAASIRKLDAFLDCYSSFPAWRDYFACFTSSARIQEEFKATADLAVALRFQPV